MDGLSKGISRQHGRKKRAFRIVPARRESKGHTTSSTWTAGGASILMTSHWGNACSQHGMAVGIPGA